jgi:hypothetical protein
VIQGANDGWRKGGDDATWQPISLGSGFVCRSLEREEQPRIVWHGIVPAGQTGLRMIRYGDPSLEALVGPESLVAGSCYHCYGGRPQGEGETWFTLSAKWEVEPCKNR